MSRRIEPALLHELDLALFEDRSKSAPPTEQRLLLAMAGRVAASA